MEEEGPLMSDEARSSVLQSDTLANAKIVTLGDLSYYDEEIEDTPPPRPRYSLLRILVGLVVIVGGLSAAGYGVRYAISNSGAASPTFFAPYVDATLTPAFQFQSPIYNPSSQVVLGFVVAKSQNSCQASWGGYYSFSGANQALDLQRRIYEYSQSGGQVMISFGGKNGTSLPQACTSSAALEQQYASTLQTYGTGGIDLDLEGAVLSDSAAINRDATAIAALEASRTAQHKSTNLWLTLPVTTSGFDANGQSVITTFLRHHVAIAGVNAMTMDFGAPEPSMSAAIESALQGAHAQLQTAFRQFGVKEHSRQVWNHMGATFMIGQNDSAGEVVTTSDAQAVEQFAASVRLRRVSFWSLNRDAACGSVFGQFAVLSNTCSGVAQGSLQFSKTFAALTGRLFVSSGPQRPVVLAVRGSTNPKNFPYPLWQPNIPYPQNYKVVWNGNVYEARYYTQGVAPSTNVQYQWQSPWLLLGPVLPTDHAPTTTTLPPGQYPSWSPTATYNQGQIVDYNGLPYQAKYYSVGSSPGNEAANPTGSPWRPLFTIPGEPSTPIN